MGINRVFKPLHTDNNFFFAILSVSDASKAPFSYRQNFDFRIFVGSLKNTTNKNRGRTMRTPACSKFKAIACLLLFVKSCLESSLLILVAGLAEKSEHVLLVSLNAGLVERIYSEEVT